MCCCLAETTVPAAAGFLRNSFAEGYEDSLIILWCWIRKA
jgi:hypothetical protein